MPKAIAKPAESLLTPNNHILIMIDFQPQMAFPTRSIDVGVLRNNVALIANTASEFKVSTILTGVETRSFSGPTFTEITSTFPDMKIIERTTMNSWENQQVVDAVNHFNKTKIVLCGLWTSVCVCDAALSAMEQGFEVYTLSDACGDISLEAHLGALERMVQVGVRPLTSVTYTLELQRDWARTGTYDQTTGILKQFGGGYGLGLIYAKEMLGNPKKGLEAA